MRRFLEAFWEWAESYGSARAATELKRLGMWQQAENLYKDK